MPYMIYQQYKTAVKNSYTGDERAADMYKKAKEYRQWLESLEIDSKLQDPLVEPILAIEEAFKDLLP